MALQINSKHLGNVLLIWTWVNIVLNSLGLINVILVSLLVPNYYYFIPILIAVGQFVTLNIASDLFWLIGMKKKSKTWPFVVGNVLFMIYSLEILLGLIMLTGFGFSSLAEHGDYGIKIVSDTNHSYLLCLLRNSILP